MQRKLRAEATSLLPLQPLHWPAFSSFIRLPILPFLLSLSLCVRIRTPFFYLSLETTSIFIGGSSLSLRPPLSPFSIWCSFLRIVPASVSAWRPAARNQATNTAGNADPDNSTADRFWHRFQRGREHRYQLDMLYRWQKFRTNVTPEESFPLAFVRSRSGLGFLVVWVELVGH